MQRNSLQMYMKTIFTMKLMYHYTMDEVENMIPWERDVYIDLINQHEKKKETNG